MPPDDRMTLGPLARSPDECSPDRFRSFLDPALEFRRKGTDLHSAGRGARAASCPIERCVNRVLFHDRELPKLLARNSVGVILFAPLGFLQTHRSPSRSLFQWIS